MRSRVLSAVGLSLMAGTLLAEPAHACLSCSGGSTGLASDTGAMGGTSSLFSRGHQWLIQTGINVRSVTGSFNELGTWNPVPVDGTLVSAQATLGILFFPDLGTSIGLQVPVVGNALSKASWGALGSISPTDAPLQMGAALGDISLQGTIRLMEGPWWALAGWAGAMLPTGNATTDAASMSGGGTFTGLGGLAGLVHADQTELSANLGYQLPFGQPPLTASTFSQGAAFLYQIQTSYKWDESWRFNLAFSGFTGHWQVKERLQPTQKWRVSPSVQYTFNGDSWQGNTRGIRAGMGADLPFPGNNSLTDWSLQLVFFQYL